MVDLGLNIKPEPRWPGSAENKTTQAPPEIAPDWAAQLLIKTSYFISGAGLVVGWMIVAAHAGRTGDNTGFGVMFGVTVSAIPGYGLLEAARVGVRMLCIIARNYE